MLTYRERSKQEEELLKYHEFNFPLPVTQQSSEAQHTVTCVNGSEKSFEEY